MKEYPYRIKEPFVSGLRTTDRTGKDINQLEMLYGMVPGEGGLSGSSVLTQGPSSLGVAFPFPQLFTGLGYNLLADESYVYVLDSALGTPTALDLYNSQDDTPFEGELGSGIWHFSDFGKSFYLYNGEVVIYKDCLREAKGLSSRFYVNDNTAIKTGCYFKGRHISAGFCDEKSLYSAELVSLFTGLAQQHVTGISNLELQPDYGFVFWSPAGGGDLNFLHNYQNSIDSLVENTGDFESYLHQLWKRGDMGIGYLPFRGDVLKVVAAGNMIVAFSQEGISFLTSILDPVVGFSVTPMMQLGINGRGCACEGGGSVVFIDDVGYLWLITPDGNIKRLGYKEFMSELVLVNTVISYNAVEHEFYITDGNLSFCLNKNGLAGVYEAPTSISLYGGVPVAVYDLLGSSTDFLVQTGEFDMGLLGEKRITTIEVFGQDVSDIVATVYARVDNTAAWHTFDSQSLNVRNVLSVPYSGLSFKILLSGTKTSDTATIDSVGIRWQLSDKRGIRGVYNVIGINS